MIRLTKILSLVCVLTMLVSCNKFIDTKPQDYLLPQNYYENERQLQNALNAIYSSLGSYTLYGREMPRMGLDADDGFYDVSTELFGVGVYDVATTDPKVANFWTTCYQGIDRANMLLANIYKATDISDENRNAIKGEALFLRSYFYFLLVSNFGGVPYLTESTRETSIPRTPAKEIYVQILNDMEEAEKLVKTAKVVGFGGRVNKSAVRGILARVNLFMAGEPINEVSRYAEAKKWAEMVIDDTEAGHELNPDFRQVFINYSADLYDIKESIWEVEYWGNNVGVYKEGGQIGAYNGIRYTDKDPNYGYSLGMVNASGVLWEKYASPTSLTSPDLRRDWTISPFTVAGNPAVETPRLLTQIYQRDCGKYRRKYEVVMPKDNQYTPINFPLLRYSDVLLMFAEADNYVNGGPSSDAIEAVNEVRKRAYGKNMQYEMLAAITVSNGGTGYTTVPNVIITGGGGSGAKATAKISGGKITSVVISVMEEGSGYTSAPTITFSGGGGTGATAIASITNIASLNADLTLQQTASEKIFLSLIQDERSRELAFEGLRKGDLVRWGKFMDNMKIAYDHAVDANLPTSMDHAIQYYKNASARDVLWPIPSYEMGLNSALKQNTGW